MYQKNCDLLLVIVAVSHSIFSHKSNSAITNDHLSVCSSVLKTLFNLQPSYFIFQPLYFIFQPSSFIFQHSSFILQLLSFSACLGHLVCIYLLLLNMIWNLSISESENILCQYYGELQQFLQLLELQLQYYLRINLVIRASSSYSTGFFA